MSYPKAAVRLPEPYGVRTAEVIGYDRRAFICIENGHAVQVPMLWVKVRMNWPECEKRFEVPMSDVKWINVEAAEHYDIHNAKVIGDGYGADQKLAAYQKEHG